MERTRLTHRHRSQIRYLPYQNSAEFLLKRFFQSRPRLIMRVVNVRAREHGAVLSQRVVAFTGEIQCPGSVKMSHSCEALLRARRVSGSEKFFGRAIVLASGHQRFAVLKMNQV